MAKRSGNEKISLMTKVGVSVNKRLCWPTRSSPVYLVALVSVFLSASVQTLSGGPVVDLCVRD